jgi:hypothetical protein
MKQYAVEYWGFMTILAESEEEAREKFKAVEHGEWSDYAEIRTIDYMCDVEKLTTQNRVSFAIQWIQRMWNRIKAIVENRK